MAAGRLRPGGAYRQKGSKEGIEGMTVNEPGDEKNDNTGGSKNGGTGKEIGGNINGNKDGGIKGEAEKNTGEKIDKKLLFKKKKDLLYYCVLNVYDFDRFYRVYET